MCVYTQDIPTLRLGIEIYTLFKPERRRRSGLSDSLYNQYASLYYLRRIYA